MEEIKACRNCEKHDECIHDVKTYDNMMDKRLTNLLYWGEDCYEESGYISQLGEE